MDDYAKNESDPKQRGDMRKEANVDDGVSGGAAELPDDKKPAMGNVDDKDSNDDYLIRAYCAALLQQRQELAERLNQQESAGVLTPAIQLATRSLDRQESMMSKREEQDEEDIEWEEEAPVAANGDYKVDLNAEKEEEEEEAAPPVNFSNDTERLQLINSIIKAPAGAQIKRVIDYLFEIRQALTPEQIKEACYVDIHANKAVFDSLRNNPKAHYDGRRFSYKAKHDVKDKSQLLSLVFKYPDEFDVADLKDAYLQIIEDLQALEASGDIIWLISNTNSKQGIVYPDGFKCPIQVDDDFKALYRDTATCWTWRRSCGSTV